jgi:hypothetical protein
MRHYERALITGASSGIGAAFAAELPASTDLLLTGRDDERLERLAARQMRPGRTVETVVADLTKADDRAALAARADEFQVDLLINNAGSGQIGAFLDLPAEDEMATVDLNVVAVVGLTRALLPGMLDRARATHRRAGLIIVSSTAAFAPVPFFASYAASKAFALHFAEALAEELRGSPADVVALCPGATRTSFGSRAGYRGGSFPGAADPRAVARDGLNALGRETVRVTGLVTQATLGPAVLPRRLITGVLGVAMRAMTARGR